MDILAICLQKYQNAAKYACATLCIICIRFVFPLQMGKSLDGNRKLMFLVLFKDIRPLKNGT